MRVARVRLQRFRGFEQAEIVPDADVVVVGEPRAGRSDLITGLRRVLEPRSTTARPNDLDVFRPFAAAGSATELTEVEVSLLDLDPALSQDLNDRLEPLTPETGLPATSVNANGAEMGLRLCYHLRYDDVTGTAEHWVDYPLSNVRASRAERDLLPVVVTTNGAPLQLRAEGVFRKLAAEVDEQGLLTSLEDSATDVSSATDRLSQSSAVRATVKEVLAEGAARVLDMQGPAPENDVHFVAEDGSLSGLLRAIQPSIELDTAGPLPLSSHGSTAAGVLAAAEAVRAASAPGAVVLADDFGDDLDAAAAEYLAALLRRKTGQVWLSTRRPEVVRAFQPEEVLRLTRSHGGRQQHQLPWTTDRKERVARRHLHSMLVPAMTARGVALLEGPHDFEGYSAVADRRLRASGTPPPAASGFRLVPAGVGDGGKEQLPKLARLAGELGFHVKVVLDNDKPGSDAQLVNDLTSLCEQVIRLPQRTAVERALVRGLSKSSLRTAFESINDSYGLGIDVSAVSDNDLEDTVADALKKKGGLHQPFVDALPARSAPPLAVAVLDALAQPAVTPVLLEIPPL